MSGVISRYLIRTVIGGALIALLVVVSLQLVFSFIDESGDVGRGGYTAGKAFLFVLLRSPLYAHEAFPVATLIGALMGLGALAARNELTAIRAAGVSVLAVARSVAFAGLILGVLAVAIGEWVVPSTVQWAQQIRAQATGQRIAAAGEAGFWARDGEYFVHVERALSDRWLQGVRIYDVAADGRIERMVMASEAHPADGGWNLQDVTITAFGADGVKLEHRPEMVWESQLKPEVLAVVVVEPETLPALGLYNYIRYLERNGLESDRYRLALWIKVAAPLATLAMLLLTIPLVFGAVRSTNAGQRVFIGVVIGLVFFLANRLLNHSALVYGLPPALSALLPTGVFMALGLWGISRTR